jgi:hypothetical protein
MTVPTTLSQLLRDLNEAASQATPERLSESGWRWAFRGSMYSAPLLSSAWNWAKRHW